MTCRSPVSGRASSGSRLIDRQPMTAAATASATMTNRWRAEKSIRRSIMHAGVSVPHTALRIEQSVSRHDDRSSGIESADDLDASCESPPGFDLARLEDTVAALDVHGLPETRFDDRFGGHGGRFGKADRELEIHEHLRPEDQTRVVRVQAQLERARRAVEARERFA